jgi:hypothetical protein
VIQLPISMPNLPPFLESVQQAVSAESLRSAARATTDPAVLLGLSVLAKSGDAVRKELADIVLRSKSEYASVLAVLTVMMERIDDVSVAELVQQDPDNALGRYLQGTLFHVSNRDDESLDAFRRAAACSELRCYDSITGEALFKAVDALGLQGRDRLCALSWTISRWQNFSSLGFQPVYWAMSELAKEADPGTRSELAEILLTLAGHLFASNFVNRFFAQRAVEAAFTLKAELLAAESLPKRQGYAAAVYGLVTPFFSVPGIKEWWNHSPQHLARDLPSYIYRAFAVADRTLMDTGMIGEANLNPPENEKPAFEAAKDRAAQAAGKLLECALPDPDGLLGPYLKGLPRPKRAPGATPLWEWSPVEGLLNKRPELFQAAAAYNEAMAALWTAGEKDPSRRNIARMMEIGWAIHQYASQHDQNYPANLELLFEREHLKPPQEIKSLRTGRPYRYVAAGEKAPSKANDRARLVLLYDDEPGSHGFLDCVFASLGGGTIRREDLEEQLKRRGK